MKVTVTKSKPVVVPPPTYNIDLTEEEFLALRSIISRRDSSSVKLLESLRLQMWANSRHLVSPFKIEKGTGALGVYHIRMKTTSELGGF